MPRMSANDRMFFYEDLGDGDPVVFVSGLGGDHRAFAVPMRRIATRRRAIALDNRDSGQSDRATTPYTTADLADDLAALLNALGIPRAHLVGQSLGGLIVQQLAIRHPRLLKSMTLISTHAGSNPWKKAVVASWVTLMRLTNPAEFTRATLPWLVAPGFYEHNAAQVDGMVRFAERNEWPQDAAAFERQALAASYHEARERLGEIRVPTLVLTGEFDLVNPPEVSRDLADRIPGARFQVLPEVGHIPHVENALQFLGVVEAFLDEVS